VVLHFIHIPLRLKSAILSRIRGAASAPVRKIADGARRGAAARVSGLGGAWVERSRTRLVVHPLLHPLAEPGHLLLSLRPMCPRDAIAVAALAFGDACEVFNVLPQPAATAEVVEERHQVFAG